MLVTVNSVCRVTIPINPKAAKGGATPGINGAATTGAAAIGAATTGAATIGAATIGAATTGAVIAVMELVAAIAPAVSRAKPPDTTGKFTEMKQEITDNSKVSSIFICTSWAVIFAHTESRSPYGEFKENFHGSTIPSSYVIIKLTLSTGTKIVVRIQLK